MHERPYVIGGFIIIASYLYAAARGEPQFEDREFIRDLRDSHSAGCLAGGRPEDDPTQNAGTRPDDLARVSGDGRLIAEAVGLDVAADRHPPGNLAQTVRYTFVGNGESAAALVTGALFAEPNEIVRIDPRQLLPSTPSTGRTSRFDASPERATSRLRYPGGVRPARAAGRPVRAGPRTPWLVWVKLLPTTDSVGREQRIRIEWRPWQHARSAPPSSTGIVTSRSSSPSSFHVSTTSTSTGSTQCVNATWYAASASSSARSRASR